MRQLSLFLLLQVIINHSVAQSPQEVDSLNLLAQKYRKSDSHQCARLAKEAIQLSKSLAYPEGESAGLLNAGIAYRNLGLIDSAEMFLNRGIEFDIQHQMPELNKKYNSLGILYKNEAQIEKAVNLYQLALDFCSAKRDLKCQASMLNNMGNAWKAKNYYDLAYEKYLASIDLKEKLGDKLGVAITRINMANVLAQQRIFKNAVEIQLQNIDFFRATENKPRLALSLYNYVNTCLDSLQKSKEVESVVVFRNDTIKVLELEYFVSKPEELPKLFVPLFEARVLYDSLGFKENVGSTLIVEGSILHKLGKLNEARVKFEKALTLISSRNYDDKANCLSNLGLVYAGLGNCKLANKYYHEAYKIARDKELFHLLIKIHVKLSNCYRYQGKNDLAFKHLKTYEILNFSQQADFVNEKLAESEIKYQSELNKRERLEAELRVNEIKIKNTSLLSSLIITLSILALLMVGFLFWQRNQKFQQIRAKEIYDQEVNKMIEDHGNNLFETQIQSQETERKRIARDIHDRLGAPLAAARMHIEAMDEPEKSQKAISLLDRAMEDARNISHNLISTVLAKFGLVPALKDLKQMVESDRRLKFILETNEFAERLNSEVEISLFRIIQEMLSNTLKHANAQTFSVILNIVDDSMELTISDDGKGIKQISDNPGMGLENIKSRAKSIGAALNIQSSQGNGTHAVILLDLR